MATLRDHMSAKKVLQELNAAAREAGASDGMTGEGGALPETTDPGRRGVGGGLSARRDDSQTDMTTIDTVKPGQSSTAALGLDEPSGVGSVTDGLDDHIEAAPSGEQTAIRQSKEMPTETLVIENGEPSGAVEAPSRRSLGNDATQLVAVPDADDAPAPAARPAAAQIDRAPSSLYGLPSEPHMAAPTQSIAAVAKQPDRGDPTLVRKADGPAHVMRDEPSLGVQHTQLMDVPAEETAVRQVFAQMGSPGADRKKGGVDRGAETLPGTASGEAPRGRARLWAGLCIGLLIGGGGWAAGTWLVERGRVAELATQSRGAIEEAHRRGRLTDYAAAEAMLARLVDKRTTDGAALSARALVLAEAQYELGGGELTSAGSAGATSEGESDRAAGSAKGAESGGAGASGDTSKGTGGGTSKGKEANQGARSWADEAQAAVRQAEGETTAVAYSAQVLASLVQGDLKSAEKSLERLQALPVAADQGSELVALPAGWRSYLASQVALLAGRDEDALVGLNEAIAKSPLPLWQRRLAEVLAAHGKVDDALAQLTAAEKAQNERAGAIEQCGIAIDLTVLRARKGGTAVQRQALQKLGELSTPPRVGRDPCGRGERARAALLSAELTLEADPAARGDARAALQRARSMAQADDVLTGDRLAAAWLRTGDARLAEEQTRAELEHVPSRRRTRLLRAEALLRMGQGSDAMRALEPLLSGAGPEDADAALLKARVQLAQNDTLDAQKLARRLATSTAVSPLVRAGAQRVLGRVSLILGEPAAARRALEPLVRQMAGVTVAPGDLEMREQQLDTQILWAEVLLSVRPAEQNEARAILEAVVTRAPERIEARLLLGRLLREIQEWGLAEQQLSAALRTDDRHLGARRELAALLMQRGDYGKAHALYRELVKEEQDGDLLIAAARAERLDGAAEAALTTLSNVKRGRGEVATKYDEALLIEKARALLTLDRCGEAASLLKPLAADVPALKKPAVPALLIRATLCASLPGERAAAAAQGRMLLMRLPQPWRGDVDVRLAECELLAATGNLLAARLGLTALVAALQTIPPTSIGEEVALRQYSQKLLERQMGGVAAAPAVAPRPVQPPR